MITNTGQSLSLKVGNGREHEFHALWLRENSLDPDNIDSRTGHKLHDSAFFPLDIKIESVVESGDEIELQFSDGHRCRYPVPVLLDAALEPYSRDLVGNKETWDAGLESLLWYEMADLEDGGEAILSFLNDVARFGFALVRGVPLHPDGMRRVTDLIGFIRYTDSGGICDVRSVPDAYDLSMTARKLEPHVDNPYRYPQPGFTLLHCLRNDAEGGESILVDGFKVAAIMRDEDSLLFEALANTPVGFRYRDEQAILEYTAPFIDTWPDGNLKQVRFHGRSDRVVAATPDRLDTFYRARRRYAELIWSNEMQLSFKLNPGEMYFADNFRIFHGRREFSLDSGERHMRQAYMDRDVVSSRQKTLMRNIASRPWQPRVHP